MVDYPCGKCEEHVTKTGASVKCHLCEQWWHKKCVTGMTDEYYDQISKTEKIFGWSGFLCRVCCKVATSLNKGTKMLEDKMKALEKESEAVKQRMDELERKQGKVEGGVKKVEEELVHAKKEMKDEVKEELMERDERSENLVIYGLKESDEEEAEERKKEDEQLVKEVAVELGAKLEDGEVEVKFRAGKKKEGDEAKSRPLIIRVKDSDKREKLLENSHRLKRKPEWTKVFISPDMTAKEREDDRKKEEERKKEAEEKTKTAQDEGKNGKWMVVGRRGRRRVVWEEAH